MRNVVCERGLEMKISELKQAIELLRAGRVTPFIWGHKGLGKSTTVRQYCFDNNIGFIDFRCAQIEGTELGGLPDKSGDRVTYVPLNDMPTAEITWDQLREELTEIKDEDARRCHFINSQARLKKGIIFLDELNRAQDDVLQAAFQLILDYRVRDYVLPQGWTVVAAGNFTEGGYITNSFISDPAMVSRFCHLTLSPGEVTYDEWADWMVAEYPEALDTVANIVEFTGSNMKWLDGNLGGGEYGFSIQPDRRGWASVVRLMVEAKKLGTDQDVLTSVISGIVGLEAAVAAIRYDAPIKPRELRKKGVKSLQKRLKKLKPIQLRCLSVGLSSIIKETVNEPGDDQDLAVDFTKYILNETSDKDVAVAFICSVISNNENSNKTIMKTLAFNDKLREIMKKAFAEGDNVVKGTFMQRIADDKELSDLIDDIMNVSS